MKWIDCGDQKYKVMSSNNKTAIITMFWMPGHQKWFCEVLQGVKRHLINRTENQVEESQVLAEKLFTEAVNELGELCH